MPFHSVFFKIHVAKSWKKILEKKNNKHDLRCILVVIFWYISIWYVFHTNLGSCLVVLLSFAVYKVFWKGFSVYNMKIIHTSHFHNLELIESKACNTPTCILIPLNNLRWSFQKIPKPTILEKTVETKYKMYFSAKKPLSLQINVICDVLGIWKQNLALFNISLYNIEIVTEIT